MINQRRTQGARLAEYALHTLIYGGIVLITLLCGALAASADEEPKGYDPDFGFYDSQGRAMEYEPQGSKPNGGDGWTVEKNGKRVYDKDYDGDYEVREQNGRLHVEDNDLDKELFRRDRDLFENELDYTNGYYGYESRKPLVGPENSATVERDAEQRMSPPTRGQELQAHAPADPFAKNPLISGPEWITVGVDLDNDHRFDRLVKVHARDWLNAKLNSRMRITAHRTHAATEE